MTITTSIFSFQPLILESLLRIFGDKHQILESRIGFNNAVTTVKDSRPTLVMLDCGGLERGVETTRQIKLASPSTAIIVFSCGQSAKHAMACLEAGASAYISLSSTAEEISGAVNAVLSGEAFISPLLASKIIAMMQQAKRDEKGALGSRLNARELQIAKLLLLGHTNREIGDKLTITEKTVKHYMTLMMQKFDTRNRVELALALPNFLETGSAGGKAAGGKAAFPERVRKVAN